MPSGSLSNADEAKFALLEPDGVSPLKRQRQRAQQATVSQRKGCIMLAFALIGLLYLAYPRAVQATADGVVVDSSSISSSSSSASTAKDASSSEDIVIVPTGAASSTTLAPSGGAASSATPGDLGDTVVVSREPTPTRSAPAEASTRSGTPEVLSTSTNADDVAVIRHVAGGDENVADVSPPPPPSRGLARFFGWLRGRRAAPPASTRVSKLIAKLHQEVRLMHTAR